jgi:hypothetical protein
MVATVFKLPATKVNTTATRWYKEWVEGAERDTSVPGAGWKRVEPTVFTIEGGIASSAVVEYDFKAF